MPRGIRRPRHAIDPRTGELILPPTVSMMPEVTTASIREGDDDRDRIESSPDRCKRHPSGGCHGRPVVAPLMGRRSE